MRGFVGYRPNPPDDHREHGLANAPDEPQYEGAVFSNGTVALCWLTAVNSHSIFTSWDDFQRVHGHPEYGTKIEWVDPSDANALAARVAELRETADQLAATQISSGSDRTRRVAEGLLRTTAQAMRDKADSLENHRPGGRSMLTGISLV